MSATSSHLGDSTAVSVWCWHADMATCRHYVGKKTASMFYFCKRISTQHSNRRRGGGVGRWDGMAPAFWEARWATVEGSGGVGLRRQMWRQKISNEGVDVDVV
jgi:hypothetical protein